MRHGRLSWPFRKGTRTGEDAAWTKHPSYKLPASSEAPWILAFRPLFRPLPRENIPKIPVPASLSMCVKIFSISSVPPTFSSSGAPPSTTRRKGQPLAPEAPVAGQLVRLCSTTLGRKASSWAGAKSAASRTQPREDSD